MTRLDAVIKDIEAVNKADIAWIYDADGNIKDDVICGSVLPLLYELKDYEVESTEKSIDWFVANANRRWNTYNWNLMDIHIWQLWFIDGAMLGQIILIDF